MEIKKGSKNYFLFKNKLKIAYYSLSKKEAIAEFTLLILS